MKQEIQLTTNNEDKSLTLALSESPLQQCTAEIYNKAGIMVRQIILAGQITKVKMDTLTPGLYILIFNSGRKTQVVRFTLL
jgi:hypothetical protein